MAQGSVYPAHAALTGGRLGIAAQVSPNKDCSERCRERETKNGGREGRGKNRNRDKRQRDRNKMRQRDRKTKGYREMER